MVQLFGRFARLPRRERQQVLLAAALLGVANLAVRLLPFRRSISIGSRSIRRHRVAEEAVVDQWVVAVMRASRAVPWRTVCIHQGLALQWLLRTHGIEAELVYGTRLAGDELEAHVWIRVGNRVVIGGEEAAGFEVLARYPADRGPRRFERARRDGH